MFFDESPQIWLILLISVPLVVFLSVFVFVYFFIKLEVTPTLEPVDEENELDAEVAHYFNMVEASLKNDGFQMAGKFIAPKMVSGTETVLMLLVNPHVRDLGLVNATFAVQGKTRRLHACFLELQTEFDDDFTINTINQEEIYPFGSRSDLLLKQLPSVVDPHELFRIHQFMVQDQASGRRKKWKWTGQPINDLQRDMATAHARIAERGYLRADAANEYYRLTIQGTLAICCKVLWPFSLFVKAKVRREEKRILALVEHLGVRSG